jgi:hypothetical protein
MSPRLVRLSFGGLFWVNRIKLIYYEAYLKEEDALRREHYFKTYNGKRFLHKRLKSYLTGFTLLNAALQPAVRI